MATSPFESGSIIYVKQFHHNQWLRVEVISPVSVGYGASARIYKGVARLPYHSYNVALKLFPHVMSEEKEELLRRELKAITRISERPMHRILPFIGIASVKLHTIIVAEYMENGNLLQYLEQKPNADRQRLLIQVAEAVHWLHGCNNLVHGDLKGENVLVDHNGHAILADFGLATLVEKEASSLTTITAIRQMNTLRFAAPELVFEPDDDEPEDNGTRPRSKTCKSDVYAFGMLILQAFTGRRPWYFLSDTKLLGKLATYAVHPRPPDEVTMLGLTESWWAVCLRCWERGPHMRPTMEWVWETLEEKRRKPRSLISKIEGLYCIALSPCGKRVISGSEDGIVAVWDAHTGDAISGPLHGHTSEVFDIALSPDGRQICSCSCDYSLRLWDTESGTPIGKPMTGHDDYVTGVTFSPDGTRIASCSYDKTVRLWNATTGEALCILSHIDPVLSVAFSPDGACIGSGSDDGIISLWDSATGVISEVLQYDESAVHSFRFLPDQIHLFAGYQHGGVRIWNIATQQLAREINAHTDTVTSIAVSPSGRYLASGSSDESIRVWDAQTGDPVCAPLIGHTDGIRSVAFSPDGRSLVSGSNDDTVCIWELFD